MRTILIAALLVAGFLPARAASAEDEAGVQLPHSPHTWLTLPAVDHRARRPFNPDIVFERHLFDPKAGPPRAEDPIEGERKTPTTWKQATVDDKGRLGGGIAYAYTQVSMKETTVALARLPGGGTLFVNGEPTPGDIYSLGIGPFPVVLRKGENHLYVKGVRGSFQLTLERAPAPVHVAGWGNVIPDAVGGRRLDAEAAFPIVNASALARENLQLRTPGSDIFEPSASGVLPTIAPLCVLQASLRLRMKEGVAVKAKDVIALPLELVDAAGDVLHRVSLSLTVRDATGTMLRTFRSRIDDSVQPWALREPDGSKPDAQKGLVLSLHGAGVGPRGQANAYSPKPDFWLAAPTNRGKFGFDWQDWGRLDAYEVLAEARRLSGVPADRTYLTGHSMGGHGTWHLAVNDPDGFAAIAPSAGWISFDTYPAPRRLGLHTKLWHRADGPSLTLSLLDNLAKMPTFILHGEDDKNVPAEQGRQMESYLKRAGNVPEVFYREGGGHWWDGKTAKGADCVDWPGIFDLFRRSRVEKDPTQLKWTTWNPAVDATHHWVTVLQQQRYGRPSTVIGRWDPKKKALRVFTDNVATLWLRQPWAPEAIQLDGTKLPGTAFGTGTFERVEGGAWQSTKPEDHAGKLHKHPERSGPFRQAWRNRFVMVYGTQGTKPETAALFQQARFDALQWTYRANGRAVLLTDAAFKASGETYKDHNVILYGNETNNAAFGELSSACPIRIRDKAIVVGDETHEGDDLGACFLFPRKDSQLALVGVMGSTGIAGARLGCTLMSFISGAGFPDYVVYGPGILTEGDGGVVTTGWFDRFWALPKKK